MAHVTWLNGKSLCGWTGTTARYGYWVKWENQCPRCKNHPDLPLLILEYLA